ncbi:uncharacterized protein LOC144181388 isoform X2 [Stigmatopora nigra]
MGKHALCMAKLRKHHKIVERRYAKAPSYLSGIRYAPCPKKPEKEDLSHIKTEAEDIKVTDEGSVQIKEEQKEHLIQVEEQHPFTTFKKEEEEEGPLGVGEEKANIINLTDARKCLDSGSQQPDSTDGPREVTMELTSEAQPLDSVPVNDLNASFSGMRLLGQTKNWNKPKDRKEVQIPPADVGQALYNRPPSSTAETLQREMEPIEAGAVGGIYGTTIGGHITEGVDSTNPPTTQWSFRPISGPAYGNRPVTPLFPGMTISYTGLPQLQRDQITSAVSLLELYCGLHNLPPPQYNLYSLLDPRGNLWLVYEVVMPQTSNRILPAFLCGWLDDAKNMAALTALWSLVFVLPHPRPSLRA